MLGVLEREHKASRLKVLYISFTFTSFHNCSLENSKGETQQYDRNVLQQCDRQSLCGYKGQQQIEKQGLCLGRLKKNGCLNLSSEKVPSAFIMSFTLPPASLFASSLSSFFLSFSPCLPPFFPSSFLSSLHLFLKCHLLNIYVLDVMLGISNTKSFPLRVSLSRVEVSNVNHQLQNSREML